MMRPQRLVQHVTTSGIVPVVHLERRYTPVDLRQEWDRREGKDEYSDLRHRSRNRTEKSKHSNF